MQHNWRCLRPPEWPPGEGVYGPWLRGVLASLRRAQRMTLNAMPSREADAWLRKRGHRPPRRNGAYPSTLSEPVVSVGWARSRLRPVGLQQDECAEFANRWFNGESCD